MASPVEVTARELRDDPRKYDGLRVRFRDIVHNQFEGMSAAGAWWTDTGGDAHEEGTHLADVDGLWSCRPSGHGHMGMWPAEIRGAATCVSFAAPRTIEEGDLRSCEELTPLVATGTAHAMMQGWFWQGLELSRLGADGRLPRVERPYAQGLRATFCRDGGLLYLASHEFVGPPRPIVPRRVERTSLSSAQAGEYIGLEGELAGGAPYPFPVQPGWPQCVNWPRLEGTFDVVLPVVATTPNRYVVPNVNTPGMAAWLERLANGPCRVRVVGEVRIAHGDPGQKPRAQLWATELDVV